jgi:tetratricopeptide (TPR) repeat protein
VQGVRIRRLRRLQTRTFAGFAVLAMALSVLAGCATDGKVKAAPVANGPSAGKGPPAARPVANGPSVGAGPSVARLVDGRTGFIITEVPTMDAASRRDFDRAVALMKDQDYGQAIDLLEKVIQQSPGVTAPYIDIAMAYLRVGKPELAEEQLKKALVLFPEHPVASNEYGLLCRKAGRFAEARAIYEKSISRFPEYYPLHRNLGILCDLYLNDPACALEHYEIYSKARPKDAQVPLWIADVRARHGRN